MSKYRFNLGNMLVAAGVTAGMGVVGGLGYYIMDDTPADSTQAAPDVREWKKAKGDTGEYRVVGPGQIVSEQGPLTYTFNFDSGHVFITGTDINSAFSFKGYDNPDQVEKVRAMGCQITRDLVKKVDEYKASPNSRSEYASFVNEEATLGNTFIQKHCKP